MAGDHQMVESSKSVGTWVAVVWFLEGEGVALVPSLPPKLPLLEPLDLILLHLEVTVQVCWLAVQLLAMSSNMIIA